MAFDPKSKGFWNLPNTLTVIRIFAVPVMVVLLLEPPSEMEAVACCVIFVVAMLTDILDGYLARKWDLVSAAGAFLDPLADKLMVISTLVMLVPLGWVPGWLVAALICRELTITALRTIALSEGIVLAADQLGKVKTAFQSTAIGFLLWHYPTRVWPADHSITVDAHSCGIVLIYIALVFAMLSAFNYLNSFFKAASANAAASTAS